MDGGAWKAAVHGVAKSQTLSNFTFILYFHALEKEMATHSSVLAWRIPGRDDALEKEMATHSSVRAWRISGTGVPCELPSMGSHRVGHD